MAARSHRTGPVSRSVRSDLCSLGEAEELEPHADLRGELLKRGIQAAIADPRPAIAGEEVFEQMREKFKRPLPEPAK